MAGSAKNIEKDETRTLPKKDPEKLHEGHREKMKARFLETGFAGFSEHQIVEMILFYVYARQDTNEIAHRLINHYGSLAGIIDASYDDLVENGKLPRNAAVLFKMIPGIIPVYHDSKSKRNVFDNVAKLKGLFEPYFISLDHEELRLACFDAQLRLNSCLTVSKGGLTRSNIDMRKLVETAINSKATSVALAHNHPKASPAPSPDDVVATQFIGTTLKAIDIKLLDHIIVGENHTISMRETAFIKVFD